VDWCEAPWVLVALGYRDKGHSIALVTQAARHNLTEFVEVFLFLLCAMTFINTMQHLNVFARMRSMLVGRRKEPLLYPYVLSNVPLKTTLCRSYSLTHLPLRLDTHRAQQTPLNAMIVITKETHL